MKGMLIRLGVFGIVVLVVTVFAATALAQTPRVGDKDGVRDPIGGAYGPANGFVDTDGDGVNDRFVDADGDGVCDKTYASSFQATGQSGDRDRLRIRTCTPAATRTPVQNRSRLRTRTSQETRTQSRNRLRIR